MSHELCIPQSSIKPPDSILGLSRLIEQDPRSEKINAGVGVFRDESGKTYTPQSILLAWEKLEFGKVDYLSPSGKREFLGDEVFLNETVGLALGMQGNNLLNQGRISAIGTVGGTGAIATFADVIKQLSPGSSILIGNPSWPNHFQIAQSRQLEIIKYDQSTENNTFNFEGALEAIKKSPEKTIVLFHAGESHNPSGVNPSADEWKELARGMSGRFAFFDAPYLGLSSNIFQDSMAMKIFLEENVPIAVAVSYAKNCGLYNERPGALIIPASTNTKATEMQRLLNWCARSSYSSPPAHGEKLVTTMLEDLTLKNLWLSDLEKAVVILNKRRKIFAENVPQFDFVAKQHGLFSLLPLNDEAVLRLRRKYAVYIPNGGRINIGGVTSEQMALFAKAIKEVLLQSPKLW